jgi:DNA-binding LytR/AlgR family response regulator
MAKDAYLSLPNKYRKSEQISLSEILYLEANLNYTLIHLKNGEVKLSAQTLLFLINTYLDESFIRIHRAFCVNKEYIQGYDQKPYPKFLWIEGGIKLSISRRQMKHVKKIELSI